MRAVTLLFVLGACNPPVDVSSTSQIEPYDPLQYVDPLIGTSGTGAEIANINPGASMPFGMTLVGPDTRSDYGAPSFYHCAGYHYPDTHIDSFSHTHAHGMGVPDYGGVAVMPRAAWDDSYVSEAGRQAPFDHANEVASPGYYAVTLDDDDIRVEIAATTHGAHHRYTFPTGLAGPTVVVDLGHALGENFVDGVILSFDTSTGTLVGYQNLNGSYSGRFGGLQTYFTAQVNPAPVSVGTWSDTQAPTAGDSTIDGVDAGGWMVFPSGTTQVDLRVALSYVDVAGADANRRDELIDLDFDERKFLAEQAWRDELSSVRVRGGTDEQLRIFHTALYHASLMPSLFIDVDGRYRGLDGEVHIADFDYYTDLSLWDTFRTLHPWYALAKPDRERDITRSLVRMAEDGGSLPKWPLGHGYTGGMVGTPADQVLAESYLKGIDGWDAEVAFDYAYAHATGPVANAGRSGITEYTTLGYVPFEAGGSSASLTLEFAWNDYGLAEWAAAMGRTDEEVVLRGQSESWRNVWDPNAGFFRGRYADGSFGDWEDGDETSWTGDYVEGNAWHYLWYVPFDVEGMVGLQHDGDTAAFLERYDTFWEGVAAEEDDQLPDDLYWHGNEPVMHYAYLGSLVGASDSSAIAARWVMANRYWDQPRGLDGNDDSGTLSAWYLFSAAGFFPIAGSDRYALGSPIFRRIEIDRPDGSTVVIQGRDTSERAMFIQSATVGGNSLDRAWFTHDELIGGGELIIELGENPVGWPGR